MDSSPAIEGFLLFIERTSPAFTEAPLSTLPGVALHCPIEHSHFLHAVGNKAPQPIPSTHFPSLFSRSSLPTHTLLFSCPLFYKHAQNRPCNLLPQLVSWLCFPALNVGFIWRRAFDNTTRKLNKHL